MRFRPMRSSKCDDIMLMLNHGISYECVSHVVRRSVCFVFRGDVAYTVISTDHIAIIRRIIYYTHSANDACRFTIIVMTRISSR